MKKLKEESKSSMTRQVVPFVRHQSNLAEDEPGIQGSLQGHDGWWCNLVWLMKVILSNCARVEARALGVEMKHKNGKKDQYLTKRQGFATVAEGHNFKPLHKVDSR